MLKKLFKLFISLSIILSTESCRVLSLSGGGVYGAFEAGVVSNLVENNNITWDIITGVSAGSINAGYISTIKPYEEKKNTELFKQLWTSMKNKDIYYHVYFLNGLSLYDNTPLKYTFSKIFKNKVPIRPVKIGSTSLKEGITHVFNETDIINLGFTDILMSSTSIPILFPPYKFNNDIYVDGGITSNILVNEGIDYCLKNFPNEKIYIDVVVCGLKLAKDENIEMRFKQLLNRIISIIAEQVEYSELLHPVFEDNIYITVYEQKNAQGYDLLDFSATTDLWNQGYYFSNVHVYWINNTINL
jgi:predicted patatin/cPLA2 family phospholipase